MSAFLWLMSLLSKKTGVLEIYHMRLHLFPHPIEDIPHLAVEISTSENTRILEKFYGGCPLQFGYTGRGSAEVAP